MPRYFVLSFFLSVWVAAAQLHADSSFNFVPRDNGEFSVYVSGARLADRFRLRFLKPAWKGNYDPLVKMTTVNIHPDTASFTADISDFGNYRVDLKKISPFKIIAVYNIEFSRKIPLGLACLSIFLSPELAQQQGFFSSSVSPAVPFPLPVQKKPFFSGSIRSLTWTDGLGRDIALTFPSTTSVTLIDNRQWSKPNFELRIKIPDLKLPGKTTFTFTLETSARDTQPKPFIDRFGQSTIKSWPGKVTSEKDLRYDSQKEKKVWDNFTPPGRDSFGGWEGTKDKFNLKATGFFYTQKVNNRWWFVDPRGNLFFSLGSIFGYTDSYTDPVGREQIFEYIPEKQGPWKSVWSKFSDNDCFSFYKMNLMRKYGKAWGTQWHTNSHNRWLHWGFNSTSSFGNRFHDIPYANGPYRLIDQCATLIPGAAGDVFEPDLPKKLDDLCKMKITPIKNDPFFIGYFFGNEQPFQKIPVIVPQLPGKFAAKRKLIELLKNRYQTIEKFNQAWSMKVKDFQTLANLKFSAVTSQAQKDMDDFLALYCDTYGRLLRQTVKKYDSNHLLLGFRWMANTANNKTIAENLGRYMDVISVNYYTQKIDPNFLSTLSQRAGDKPILLSEWSYGTCERGHTGGVQNVANQKERGQFYQAYIESAATVPCVVGCHWFEYVDQAITGRFFGGPAAERCNCGLVDIADRPYQEFIDYIVKTNYRIYDLTGNHR